MSHAAPNFSKISRKTLGLGNALARWVRARPVAGGSSEALAGAPVRVVAARVGGAPDPHASAALVKVGTVAVPVLGAAGFARGLAQRLLGGPAELGAPRPLTMAEHAVFAAFVAALLADTGIGGEVWPLEAGGDDGDLVEVTLTVGTLWLRVRDVPRFTGLWRDARFDFAIVAARCALPIGTALAAGDTVIVERGLEIVVGAGAIGLTAAGRVATGYVPRDMLPDAAHFELTVQVGTARLTLREVAELSAGQVIPLGRSLTDPLDVHAAGRRIGQGVLVDVDGELGVRIVSVDP